MKRDVDNPRPSCITRLRSWCWSSITALAFYVDRSTSISISNWQLWAFTRRRAGRAPPQKSSCGKCRESPRRRHRSVSFHKDLSKRPCRNGCCSRGAIFEEGGFTRNFPRVIRDDGTVRTTHLSVPDFSSPASPPTPNGSQPEDEQSAPCFRDIASKGKDQGTPLHHGYQGAPVPQVVANKVCFIFVFLHKSLPAHVAAKSCPCEGFGHGNCSRWRS